MINDGGIVKVKLQQFSFENYLEHWETLRLFQSWKLKNAKVILQFTICNLQYPIAKSIIIILCYLHFPLSNLSNLLPSGVAMIFALSCQADPTFITLFSRVSYFGMVLEQWGHVLSVFKILLPQYGHEQYLDLHR